MVFGSLVGYTTYIWLVGNVAPSQATTYAYVNPVVAVLLGWAIAGERVDGRVIGAAVAIVGAVVLVTLGQSRGRLTTERRRGNESRNGAPPRPAWPRQRLTTGSR